MENEKSDNRAEFPTFLKKCSAPARNYPLEVRNKKKILVPPSQAVTFVATLANSQTNAHL
jgi:hypothetical protein